MIKLSGVTKKFNDFTAIDKVNCEIPDGCIYGMVGSNGAGKSTVLRTLSGIYKADSGNVLINGYPVFDNYDIKKDIVFIGDDLYFLSGASPIRMAALYKRIYPDFDFQRFKSANRLFQAR